MPLRIRLPWHFVNLLLRPSLCLVSHVVYTAFDRIKQMIWYASDEEGLLSEVARCFAAISRVKKYAENIPAIW